MDMNLTGSSSQGSNILDKIICQVPGTMTTTVLTNSPETRWSRVQSPLLIILYFSMDWSKPTCIKKLHRQNKRLRFVA